MKNSVYCYIRSINIFVLVHYIDMYLWTPAHHSSLFQLNLEAHNCVICCICIKRHIPVSAFQCYWEQ